MNMRLIFVLAMLLFGLSRVGLAQNVVKCEYRYGQFPSVILSITGQVDEAGGWAKTAHIAGWGLDRNVSVTVEEAQTDAELYRLLLAKEDAENTIQVILFKQGDDSERKSRAINPNMPKGWGELDGGCKFAQNTRPIP